MELTLTWTTLITAAASLTAAGAIAAALARAIRWIDRQRRQDAEILAIKEELTLLSYGVLACLKGLREQGCNGPVTDAIGRIEKHLNRRAHA